MQAKRRAGFTLIEILVIAPIVILFIGAFIALIVSLTGESIKLQASNAAAFSTQDTLDDIEASTLQATGFLATTGAVQSPQGKDNATAAFVNDGGGSNPDTLIISAAATTKGPYDPTRSVIYTGTGTCNTNNPIYTYTTIYFVNTTDHALYKRTILPQIPACAVPWQRGSCQESLVAANSTVCKTSDEKLLDNVTGMTIQYYSDALSTTPMPKAQATTATSIEVSIATSKSTAGEPITYSASSRVSAQNVQSAENSQTPPATPSISTSNDINSGNESSPYRSIFTWDGVGSADGYTLRYRVNGGSWSVANLSSSATTYTINTDSRKAVVEIELTVKSQAGNYLYGTASTTNPRWQTCSFQSGWTNYGNGYAGAGFTRTSAGVIGLRGLIANGTISGTANVCTLPVGFRPAQTIMFQVGGYEGGTSGSARVDVYSNGDVRVSQGENPWVSLSGITFLAYNAPTSVGWTNGTYANGWTNYSTGCTDQPTGNGWGCFKYAKDTLGRVFTEGLGRPGTVTAGTTMGTLSSSTSIAPSNGMHVPSRTGGNSAVNIGSTGAITVRGIPASPGYQAVSFTYYPASFTSWVTLPLTNSWANYGSGWSPAQCYKGADDLVIVRGLVRSGAAAGLTMNLDAVGCGIHTDGRLIMPAWMSANSSARLDVLTDGTMTFVTPYSTAWTSIDSVRFIAD